MKIHLYWYFVFVSFYLLAPSQVDGRFVDSVQRLRNFRCDQVKGDIDLSSNSTEILTFATEMVDESVDICWNVTTKKGWKVRFHVLQMELEYCFTDCRQCHFLEFHNRKPRSILPILELDRIRDRQCTFSSEPMPFYFTSSDRTALIRLHLDKLWKVNGSVIKIEMWKVEKDEKDERDNENCDPSEVKVIDTNKFPLGTIRNFIRSDGQYRLNETCRWYLENKDPFKTLRFIIHRVHLPGACLFSEKWFNCYQYCDEIGTSVGIWNKRGEIDNGSLIFKGCGIYSPIARYLSPGANATVEFVTSNNYQHGAVKHFGFIIEYQRTFYF